MWLLKPFKQQLSANVPKYQARYYVRKCSYRGYHTWVQAASGYTRTKYRKGKAWNKVLASLGPKIRNHGTAHSERRETQGQYVLISLCATDGVLSQSFLSGDASLLTAFVLGWRHDLSGRRATRDGLGVSGFGFGFAATGVTHGIEKWIGWQARRDVQLASQASI